MLNKHVSFVILHYYTIDDTITCINSIKEKCGNSNYSIVVVDNASPNNTGEMLRKKYADDDKIHVIVNDNNLGFARGNNVGFKYSKYNLHADFIILCNNDICILQDDFLRLIEEEYSNSKFAVLGPKIILKDNKINNIRMNIPTIKHVKELRRRKIICYITSMLFVNRVYVSLRRGIKNFFVKVGLKKDNIYPSYLNDIRHENIVLHGCCLIFSREYINLFDGLSDKTFLYMEEDLLAIRLKKYKLKSVYSPKLIIYHDEDSSTNAISINSRKKNMFVSKHFLKSSKVVLYELKKLK